MPDNPIYNFLKQNNLTDKDQATFEKEYADPQKAQVLYSFFKQNDLTDKDSASFYNTYFKDFSQPAPQQQQPATPKVSTNDAAMQAMFKPQKQASDATHVPQAALPQYKTSEGNVVPFTKPQYSKPEDSPYVQQAIDNEVAGSKKDRKAVVDAYKKGDIAPIRGADGKVVMKPTGNFIDVFKDKYKESFFNGVIDDYLTKAPKEEAIKFLNNKDKVKPLYEPQVAPKSMLGEGAGWLGSQADFLIGAAAHGALGAAALPETAGASAFSAFAGTAPGIAKSSYSQALQHNYAQLKQQHPDMPDSEVFDKANNAALAGEATGLATNAVLSGSIFGDEAAKPVVNGFVNALEQTAKHIGSTAPKSIGAGVTASVANDIASQLNGVDVKGNEVVKHAMEAAQEWAVLHTAMGIVQAAPSIAGGAVQSLLNPQAKNVLNAAPREQVLQMAQQAEDKGEAPQGSTEKLANDLENFDLAKKSIPPTVEVKEETKAAIANKLLQKAKLTQQISELQQHGDAFADKIEGLNKQVSNIDATINQMTKSDNPFLHETDAATGEPLTPRKSYEDLSGKEKAGIQVPKEYGSAEVTESGEGENKTFKPVATVAETKGGLVVQNPIEVNTEGKTFTDKAKAQEAADKALAQHYYENGMHDGLKPLVKEEKKKDNGTDNQQPELPTGTDVGDNQGSVQGGEPSVAEPAAANANELPIPEPQVNEPSTLQADTPPTAAVENALPQETPLPEGQVHQSGVLESAGGTGQSDATATPAVPELKPVEYTTQSGKYKVTAEGVIDIKTGKEPSRSTVKRAINEAADKYDFTAGKPSPEEADVNINSADDYTAWRIDKSTKPSELADIYVNEPPATVSLNTKEQMIAEYGIGKVKTSSFDQYNDRNNRNVSIARSYLDNTKGRPLDSIAKEISDHYDVEISPEEVADFMRRFPNGVADAYKTGESALAARAKAKFKELTGFDLNNEIAEKAINQEFKKLSDEQQRIAEQEFYTQQQLEEEYWRQFAGTTADDVAEESTHPEAKPAESPAQAPQESSPQEPPASEITGSEQSAEPNRDFQLEEAPTEGGSQVGVHHAALTELATKLGLQEPERGDYLEPEEYAKRGRALLDAGADPNEVSNPNNTLHDRIAIARAHLEDLMKAADDAARAKGVDSKEYEAAATKAADYANNTVKPLGTEAHRAMVSLQGTRDIDTGSFTTVKQKVEEVTGKPLTKEQAAKVEELTTQNEQLKQQAAQAEKELVEATDKAFKEGFEKGKAKSNSEKAKVVANKLREQAKIHKPNTFNAATPASLVWDAAIEVVATSIEAGGKIADAIEAGVQHVRSSDWYKTLTDEKKAAAEQEFKRFNYDNAGGKSLEDLQARFADKKGNDFTTEEAKALWDYTKETYLDKGTPYREAIGMVSNDLGLSWRQVSEAFITPKSIRDISDAMWKKQADLRKAQNATKRWIDDQSKSPAYKIYKKASDGIRGLQVWGHGAIFVGTHAGMTAFQPSTFTKTLQAFINGYKFAYGKEASYERAMEELKNRPNYVAAQRAGLKNDPDRMNVEEFQKSQTALGRFGHAGERGFNAIKVLRQDIFDYHFDKLTDAQKADPEVAKSIARLANNATGATNVAIPEWVNEATFAGGMEVARWEKITRNPVEASSIALRTLWNADKVSAADKVFAKVWARRVGEQLATFTTMLAMNAVIQKQVSPQNATNMTDPNKPDFLKFKFGDNTLDPTSGMVGVTNFIIGLVGTFGEDRKELRGDTKLQAVGKKMIGYARGKASPFAGTAIDMATQTDFNNNQLPLSNIEPSVGKRKISWWEYMWEKMPLPVAEAAKVAYQSAADAGADKVHLNHVLHGIALGALSGSTGFRVGEYVEKADLFTDAEKKDPVFKYFLDKDLKLPITSLQAEKVTDAKAGTVKTIADYPKEQQDQYQSVHKEELKKVLAGRIQHGVYVKTMKNGEGKDITTVSLTAPDDMRHVKKTPVKDLTKEQLTQLLSAAQSEATTRTKKKVFKVK